MRGRRHERRADCINDLRNALAIAMLRGNRSAEAKLVSNVREQQAGGSVDLNAHDGTTR
jgi:hypothetical protein